MAGEMGQAQGVGWDGMWRLILRGVVVPHLGQWFPAFAWVSARICGGRGAACYTLWIEALCSSPDGERREVRHGDLKRPTYGRATTIFTTSIYAGVVR